MGCCQLKIDSYKANFNLFNPTSKNLMRGFETDRPDITESAYTVDAGHFQLETDFFKTEKTNYNDFKAVDNYYNFINLKLGLTNNVDIQFVISPLVTSNIKTKNSASNISSFGNISLRIKRNLWGNDGGKSALAIIPFINFPKQSQKLNGGIILPLAITLPSGWGFGTQIQTDFVENQSKAGYHLNYLLSATTSHQLMNKTNFFIESYLTRETEKNLFEYFLNGGLIYEISHNLKSDIGFNYGLKSISSTTYFIGLSFRY